MGCNETKPIQELDQIKVQQINLDQEVLDLGERINKIRDLYPNNLMAKSFSTQYFQTLSFKDRQKLLKNIKSGLDNPNSEVGCYAMYPEDFQTFNPFFSRLLQYYHQISPSQIHQSDWNVDQQKYKLSDISPTLENTSIRVRVGRNSRDFPLPGAMTLYHRIMFEHRILNELIGPYLIKNPLYGGQYYSITPGMKKQITKEFYNQLVKEHKMFKDMSSDPFLNSAGISNDWPNGRGMYESQNKDFLMWIGEEDHLRIMYMYKGDNLATALIKLKNFVHLIEKSGINLMYDTKYGAVTSCPSNLGTGMRFSVHLSLPKLTQNGKNMEYAKAKAKEYGLSVRGAGGEHTEPGEGGIVDISPTARLMIKENEIIDNLYQGIKALMTLENQKN